MLPQYNTLLLSSPSPFVVQVQFNRPQRYNAISKEMWREMKQCFEDLAIHPDCRVIVVTAAGKHFCAGLDLNDAVESDGNEPESSDVARRGNAMGRRLQKYQEAISALELCPKPVIVLSHGACIGAGVDFITAADIRFATQDCYFQVKEVDIGMAADVGTLQRLPKAVGSQSWAREICFTGRRFNSNEAFRHGLLSKVYDSIDVALAEVLQLAQSIAEKSPIAIQGTKENLVYSQNRTNQEGLDQIRIINRLYLQSEDFMNATLAQMTKAEKPVFAKL